MAEKQTNVAWRRNPAAKQDSLLSGARELFVEFGFVNTTTARIAEHCGVSEATLFHYFKSKEGLLRAVVRRYADGMVRVIKQDFDSRQPPVTKDVVERMFRYVEASGQPIFVLERQTVGDPDPGSIFRHEITSSLRDMFTQWQKQNIALRCEPEQLAAIAFGLVSAGLVGCFIDDKGRNKNRWLKAVTATLEAAVFDVSSD